MTDFGFLRRAWPDMCAAYRDAALAQACLDMQESFDADIPLLLVLCLADRAGHGVGRNELEALADASAAWREAVIRPLRLARQAMKGRFGAPAEVALRSEIKRLELEAERLHVQRLTEAFPAAVPGSESAVLCYLGHRGVPVDAAHQFFKTFNLAHDAQVQPAPAAD